MNTRNSQCVFFTSIHSGLMERFLFYCPLGSKVILAVSMLVVRGGCD